MMNLHSNRTVAVDRPVPEPNISGKLKGYCTECGMMIIESEEACPVCEGTKTTQLAPGCPDRPYTNGRTPYTSGTSHRIHNV